MHSDKMPNVFGHDPPTVSSWTAGCASTRKGALVSAAPPPRIKEYVGESLKDLLAAEVLRDIHHRGVLCNATISCNATILNASGELEICLPTDPATREARLCEPWGDRWQQRGWGVGTFSESGCVRFNLSGIAEHVAALRARPAFLARGSERQLRRLLAGKKLRGRAEVDAAMARMHELLPAAAEVSRRYRRCAVVGSGSDLICYKPHRGVEIDQHDAVWRSNVSGEHPIDILALEPPECFSKQIPVLAGPSLVVCHNRCCSDHIVSTHARPPCTS